MAECFRLALALPLEGRAIWSVMFDCGRVCRCTHGYSTSRTCEMGLSKHSGVPFQGIVYLVDEATKPKQAATAQAAARASA